MNEMFYILNFQQFINEFGQYVLWNFEPIGNVAHTTVFLTLGKVLLIPLSRYL